MIKRTVQLKVWIDCPTCGRLKKLERELPMSSESVSPINEKTCAVCERCRGVAVMCFERRIDRVH